VQSADEWTTGNWDAVVQAIKDRLAHLGITVDDLIERSGVGRFTVREILANNKKRRRRTSTLVKLATALEFPANHLIMILQGKLPPVPPDQTPFERNLVDQLLNIASGTHAEVIDTHAEIREMHRELREFMRQFGNTSPNEHLKRHRP